ncbi:MAG TPA: HAMP domain-containing sensor histidine kinase [Solirubrobacteraceae bacterium]|jgi:two-component system sensor histidine kinase BaeS
MRSLRVRLFLAILGTVLIGVGASLALGVVLTKSAVRETIRRDIERQANAFARQLATLPADVVRRQRSEGDVAVAHGQIGTAQGPSGMPQQPPPRASGAPPPAQAPLGAAPTGAAPTDAAPAGQQGQVVLGKATAERLLPSEARATLRRTGSVDGTARLLDHEEIYAARAVAGSVALVVRPDVVSGTDFRRYLAALLIASGAATLLAMAVAALLSRQLTKPLRRLGAAVGVLARGGEPEPVPNGGTIEVDELATAFNEMSSQLALARDAERGVLLSVSHDLRTPLTSIRGYAEGIEDGTIDPREGAGVVAREALRLERLVGDLLALARLRQGVLEVHREEVDLVAIAHEAEARLRPRAAERGVRVLVPEGGSAAAVADHGRVLQVLSNLLDNALRVSPEGGEVRIEATPGTLSVSDAGPGVPEAEIPRAFERFHLRSVAGNGAAGGAGLGLAIVRELSEAMGGSAAVENLPGGGARFTVRLPQA